MAFAIMAVRYPGLWMSSGVKITFRMMSASQSLVRYQQIPLGLHRECVGLNNNGLSIQAKGLMPGIVCYLTCISKYTSHIKITEETKCPKIC